MAPIRLLVARLRQNPLPLVLLVLLVFATALLAAAAPRLFNRAADAGLRYEVREATTVERNLQLGRITDIGALTEQGMEPVADVEATIHESLPASVRTLISGESFFAESVVWSVLDRPPTRPGFVTLHAEDVGEQVRLVEGRMPTGTTSRVSAPRPPSTSVPLPPGPREALLFEVALSTTTAEELDVGVGSRMQMIPDTADILVGPFGFPEPVAIDVVGLYEVVDPDADYWVGDRGLHEPSLVPVGINTVLVYSTALLSPDAYPAMTQLSWPMRYTFRYTIDPERMNAGMLDQLVLDLRRMGTQYASFATAPDPTRTTLQTGLPGLLERFRAEHRTAEAVLVTAAIGPAAVALVAVGVLALLAVRRRRQSLVLLRGRGGSAPQLTGSHLLEGLLLAAAPAALAAWLATQLVDARATPLTPFAAGMVAVATVLIVAGAALPVSLASLRGLERPSSVGTGAGPRRLAFEALVVVLAVAGVVLLRQRGLAGGSAAGELAGVDPFLAAVPALVGLAVGVVTVRLYPYPVRAAGLLAGGVRGLTPALGLRRAERQAGGGHLPLIVLLLTVAIGTFSSTMLATIDRGQIDTAWETVGAAHRVEPAGIIPLATEPIAELEAVHGVAVVHEAEATVGIAGGTRVSLVAIEAADYEAVTGGTPVETTFPPGFHAEVGEERPGMTTTPIPAIVSTDLQRTSTTDLEIGDTFELTIQARFATFEVADVRSSMPGVPEGRAFIAVPRHLLLAGLRDRALPPTALYVGAPPSTAAAVEVAMAEAGIPVDVTSQAGELAALRERPLVQAIEAGFTIALAAAVAYAGLAVTISLVLAGTARARETAHLRTMGVDRAQVLVLAVLEHAPPVLVALIGGLLLGVAVGWVVLPGLGLAAFTGAPADPALTVDIGQLAVLTVALTAIVAVGIGLSAWAQRRTEPARAVREGLE